MSNQSIEFNRDKAKNNNLAKITFGKNLENEVKYNNTSIQNINESEIAEKNFSESLEEDEEKFDIKIKDENEINYDDMLNKNDDLKFLDFDNFLDISKINKNKNDIDDLCAIRYTKEEEQQQNQKVNEALKDAKDSSNEEELIKKNEEETKIQDIVNFSGENTLGLKYNERNIKDIDINRINSKVPTIRENHSPTKETQKENSHEILMKSETKKSRNNKNDNITFKKRNFTHKNYKRNSPLIHVTTLKNIKHNQLISFSNINSMSIFRNSTNKRHYNSYFNSQLGKFGTNNISSFNFSSGVKDHFCEIFKNINSKLKLSGQLFNNKTLILDKYGLEHSHKKEFNGVASFGFTNSGIALSLYDYVFDKDISLDKELSSTLDCDSENS